MFSTLPPTAALMSWLESNIFARYITRSQAEALRLAWKRRSTSAFTVWRTAPLAPHADLYRARYRELAEAVQHLESKLGNTGPILDA